MIFTLFCTVSFSSIVCFILAPASASFESNRSNLSNYTNYFQFHCVCVQVHRHAFLTGGASHSVCASPWHFLNFWPIVFKRISLQILCSRSGHTGTQSITQSSRTQVWQVFHVILAGSASFSHSIDSDPQVQSMTRTVPKGNCFSGIVSTSSRQFFIQGQF